MKKYTQEWICTDSDTGQYGRQLAEFLFEFKERGKFETTIYLPNYKEEVIEKAINSYGYTLFKSHNGLTNIDELYPNRNWIIAECLFELNM